METRLKSVEVLPVNVGLTDNYRRTIKHGMERMITWSGRWRRCLRISPTDPSYLRNASDLKWVKEEGEREREIESRRGSLRERHDKHKKFPTWKVSSINNCCLLLTSSLLYSRRRGKEDERVRRIWWKRLR